MPDDLPGPRLVVGEGLRVPVGEPQVGLQRPADDRLVERDAVRLALDSATTAKPRSGTVRSSANWPLADPPCPTVRTPSTSRRNQPMPKASPSVLPRNLAVAPSSGAAPRRAGYAHRFPRGRHRDGTAPSAVGPPPRTRYPRQGCDRAGLSTAARWTAFRPRRGCVHNEAPGHDVVAREENCATAPAARRRARAMACSYGWPGDLLDDPPQQAVARLAVGDPGYQAARSVPAGPAWLQSWPGVISLHRCRGEDLPSRTSGLVEHFNTVTSTAVARPQAELGEHPDAPAHPAQPGPAAPRPA